MKKMQLDNIIVYTLKTMNILISYLYHASFIKIVE